jgi:predicted dehydrogenase
VSTERSVKSACPVCLVVLRTAIVGLGTVAQWHRRGIERTPNARLVAVADTDPDRLDHLSNEWRVPGYADTEALLADADLDWIHVCTPAQTHYEVATACLEADAHALVEKPFVMTPSEFRDLVSTADDCDRRVSAVHNQVYYRPLRTAYRRLKAGEFGRLHGASVRWAEDTDPGDSNRGDWVLDLPGGEFGEGIVHPLYVGLRFAGYPADEEAVSVHRIDATDTAVGYDGVAVGFTTANDTVCTVQHHSNVPDQRRIDLAAEDAHVTVDVATQSVTVQRHSFGPNSPFERPLLRAGLDTARRGLHAATQAARRRVETALTRTTVHDTHTPVIRREARAIRAGGRGPTPREEARWATYLFDRVNDLT